MTSSPLVEETKPKKPANGEPCPHCGSVEPWGPASWCPACGYYPSLGGTALRSAEEVEADDGDWDSLHDGPTNLLEAIPRWAWPMLGGVIFILAANAVLRLAVPMKPSLRTLLTVLEFTIGVIVAAFAHGSAYLAAACKSDKYAPFDYFMKPIELWKPTFHKLPEGSRRVCGMAWGTTAMFSAVLLLGGFEFDAMFDDWGFEQPELEKPVHVIRKKKPSSGDEDLEDAVARVVTQVIEEDTVALKTRCVILGYFKTDKGELGSLVLGSAPRGRLAYVGLLSQTDIPEEHRADLLKQLQQIDEISECHIKEGVPLKNAIWVQPKLLCVVEHKSWTTQYRLEQPKFMELVSPEEEKEKAEKKKKKLEKAKKQESRGRQPNSGVKLP